MSYFWEFTLRIQKEKVGVSGLKDTLWESKNIQVCILLFFCKSNIFFLHVRRMQNTKSWPIFCCHNNEWYFWFAVGTSNLLCHLFLLCQSKRFASRQQAWKGAKISLWMEYCMKKKKLLSIPFWLFQIWRLSNYWKKGFLGVKFWAFPKVKTLTHFGESDFGLRKVW